VRGGEEEEKSVRLIKFQSSKCNCFKEMQSNNKTPKIIKQSTISGILIP
jgi:hypothetical protein